MLLNGTTSALSKLRLRMGTILLAVEKEVLTTQIPKQRLQQPTEDVVYQRLLEQRLQLVAQGSGLPAQQRSK